MPAEQTVPIEIMTVGRFAGRDWTERDLDDVARNCSLLAPYIRPPLKLAVGDRQVLAQDGGQPSLGWCSRVKRVGSKLIGEFTGMPKAVRELVRSGAYKRVACDFYERIERTNFAQNLPVKATGAALSAVALLGLDVPQVDTLERLAKFLAVERPLAFAEPAPGTVALTLSAARSASSEAVDCDYVRRRVDEAVRAQMAEYMSRRLAEEHARRIEEIEMATKNNFTASDIEAWPSRDPHRAAVEEVLEALGINHGDAAKVLAVRQLVAGARESLNPHEPGFLQRIVAAWPDYRPDKPPMAPPGKTVSIGEPAAYGRSWAELHRPGVPNVSQNVTRAGHAADAKTHDMLPARFKEAAEAEGVADISKATLSERDRIARRVAKTSPSEIPLYGFAAQEAARVGSRRNYDLLRELASRHNLSLDRSGERRFAERMLWDMLGATVETATTFDQALHAICASEKLSGSERDERMRAVKLLAERRPDLVVEYGRGTVIDEEPQTFGEGAGLDDEAKELRFEEEVVKRLAEQGLPDLPAHRQKATLDVSRLRKDLLPSYGWR